MTVTKSRHPYRSHLIIGVVLVVLGFSALIFVPSVDEYQWSAPEAPTIVEEIIPTGPLLEASAPVRLRIPAVGIEAPFGEELSLAPDGSSEVPEGYEEVGWYKHGPTPGELGPAVVLGHVDSIEGPAVFFSLGQLAEGDDIYVDRADGTSAHFVVTTLERPPQYEFPTAKVYGDIDHAGLRLITCSGRFERGEQRYTHNLIVYARLVE